MSVRALLHAACSSPTARQSGVSCCALLWSCWAAPPAGTRLATVEDLPLLVAALREAEPGLAAVEDSVPLDPRELVYFRARSPGRVWHFRVHPGSLEAPLQALQGVVNYAEALDPVLMGRFGFGLADMLEVASQMLDRELSILTPAWSGMPVSLDSASVVTEEEVAAAAQYLETWSLDDLLRSGQLEGDADPRREQLALAAEALTADTHDLSFAAGPDRAPLGSVLFVNAAGMLPVPSALVIQGLMAAVTTALHLLPLAADAASQADEGSRAAPGSPRAAPPISVDDGAQAGRRWRARAESDLAWACRGIPATILFGELVEEDHDLLLIGPGQRHVVAVGLVSGLTGPEVADGVAAAWERLARFGPGSLFRISPPREEVAGAGAGRTEAVGQPPEGTTDESLGWFLGTADAVPFPPSLLAGESAALAEGTDVTRLIVVDGPWQHGPRWTPGIPACTLDEFRALLTAQDWASTDREELWSFLDELTSLGGDEAGNGYVKLICWSILDAWDAWQASGMLCPAWLPPETQGRIPPRDLDLPWARDAALDRVDALLASFDMAEARQWSQLIPTLMPIVQDDDGEQSLTATAWLYQPRKAWWICPDQELIVAVDLDFHDDLTFSRSMIGGLASTIVDTLVELARTQRPGWDVWRQVHGNTPVLIRLTPARLRDGTAALRFVALGDQFSQLCVDPARLEGLDNGQVHNLIGDALIFALLARMQPLPPDHEPAPREDEHAVDAGPPRTEEDDEDGSGSVVLELDPSDQDIEKAEAFRAAWQSISPCFTQRRVETPFPPHSLTAPQTLTEGGETRAARTIARRFAGQLVAGQHPLSAVLEQLCPGALDALSDTAQRFTARAALAAACAELERALANRFASRINLELNLESPWAEEVLADLDTATRNNEAQRSRIAELLVECLLHRPPSGELAPDRRDVHHLLDMAAAALHASLDAQYAYAALRPARVEISDLGDMEIVPTAAAKADFGAWRRAQLEAHARAVAARRYESPDPGGPLRETGSLLADDHDEHQWETLRSVLQDQASARNTREARDAQAMLTVDDRLLQDCGFGLDSVRAVLSTVASWRVPEEPFPPIAHVSRADLADRIMAWSGLPRQEIGAAVRACTLTAARIQEEDFKYWQLEQRSARLALRPLIEPPHPVTPDELWLLPRSAHRTQHVLLTYLNDRRLPWPDKNLPRAVRDAIRAWRQITEDALETELAKAAEAAGLLYRPRMTIPKAAAQNVTLAGEIDLLAADPARRRIWVVEAKHLRQPFSALEMAFHVADFYGPSALAIGPGTNEFRQFQSASRHPYVQRILANADAVRRNIGGALRLINPSSSGPDQATAWSDEGDWQVIELAVTSHTEIAAFVTEPKVPFVAIDYLSEMFAAADCPPPGWWAPWNQETG